MAEDSEMNTIVSAGRLTRSLAQKLSAKLKDSVQNVADSSHTKTSPAKRHIKVKLETDEACIGDDSEAPKKLTDSEPKSTKGVKRPSSAGREPDNWAEVLENIRQMRKNKDAPVDTMGCDKLYDDDVSPQVHHDLLTCNRKLFTVIILYTM